MVYIFLADGFEETEAIAPCDILKRGGIDARFCSIYPERKEVIGAHGIKIVCDCLFNDLSDAEMLVLPGGMPGTRNLQKCEFLHQKMLDQFNSGKLVAAICAAPTVLGAWGMLADKKATCYPGMEDELYAKTYLNSPSVRDGNVITGKGAGAAFDFGLMLLEALTDKETADKIKNSMYIER